VASIVFICTANMCRSAIAEGILQKRLLEVGRSDIKVSSMGIHGRQDERATDDAVSVCFERGIDISAHCSRPIIPEELIESNLIFVMEPVQKEFLFSFFPRVNDRVYLLGCWPGEDHRKGTVKDPTGGKADDFRKCFQIISTHIERILPIVLDKYPRSSECVVQI
jgi:protein-tyrosine-phosphatase